MEDRILINSNPIEILLGLRPFEWKLIFTEEDYKESTSQLNEEIAYEGVQKLHKCDQCVKRYDNVNALVYHEERQHTK